MSEFETQRGDAKAIGWQAAKERIHRIPRGENPYRTGDVLEPNSPLFFGRNQIHHRICQKLRSNPPQSVSLLGERRIGKSSLLNQIYQALASENDMLVVKTSFQDFQPKDPADFYHKLHQALCQALNLQDQTLIPNFDSFNKFIEAQAEKTRFVILLDEFERLSSNNNFDADFFANLRTLAYEPKYRLAYLTASRLPLRQLCQDGGIEESSFWNIFTTYTLGLLSNQATAQLMHYPFLRSLGLAPQLDKDTLLNLTGQHPAFLQIALFEIWVDLSTQADTHWQQIRRQLREHHEHLWEVRSDAEKTVLLQCLSKQTPRDTSTLDDLQLRGLIDEKEQLFSGMFTALVEQEKPQAQKKGLIHLIDDAEQAGQQVGRLRKLYQSIRKTVRELRSDWKGESASPKDDDEHTKT